MGGGGGETTAIEWTDATWTPIRARNKATGKVGWHCEHASPGCQHCYSESFNEKRLGTGLPFKPGHRGDVVHFLDEAMLLAPLRWRRPRRIFVCSMTDLFGEWVEDAWIDRVFAVMALCPQHTFQVLTKRSARMRAYLTGCVEPPSDLPLNEMWVTQWHRRHHVARAIYGLGPKFEDRRGKVKRLPLPNVWLGVSAEDQRRADERVPDLLATPAAVRFVSAEPLLGPVDFTAMDVEHDRGFGEVDALRGIAYAGPAVKATARIDWMIVGGESGHGARPTMIQWVRSIRDQCAAASVAFHFKQWGHFTPDDPAANRTAMRPVGKKAAGRLLDGVEHNGMPEVRS